MTLDLKNDGLQLALFVNNISNQRRINFVYDAVAISGSQEQSVAAPRWVGFSIRKSL
jgi:hypothetical protein